MEMVVAISISSILLIGVTFAFQGFSSFNTWIFHFSYLQQQSAQELIVLNKSFKDGNKFLNITSPSPWFHSVYAKEKDSLLFHNLQVVDSVNNAVTLTDTEGYLAMQSSLFFSDMIQVGNIIYVSDPGNHVIRKIDTSVLPLQTQVLAGEYGVAGSSDGVGVLAHFRHPTGLVHYNGDIYVSDTGNHSIRKIVIATATVSLFAGKSESPGNFQGPLLQSFFQSPTGITVNNNNGDIYVSDTGNHVIKKISGGVVISILGTGTEGKKGDRDVFANFQEFPLYSPLHLTFYADLQHLYINDFQNKRLLRVREGLDVVSVTENELLYGGIRVVDGVSPYLQVQELSSGNVYNLDVLDFSVQDTGLGSFWINGANYLQIQLIQSGNISYLLALDKLDNKLVLISLDKSTNTELLLFGLGGSLGQLSIFNPLDYKFYEHVDFIGNSRVKKSILRESITDSGKPRELLLYFDKTYGRNELIESSYSLVFKED